MTSLSETTSQSKSFLIDQLFGVNWVWWYKPVILKAVRMLRQEEHEFQPIGELQVMLKLGLIAT